MFLKIEVSGRIKLVKYKNKNFSVGRTDNLLINIKKSSQYL